MTGHDEDRTIGRIASSSVRAATGHGWTEWLETLDAAGATGWSHKEIVAYLEREHAEVGSWWRQTVAVGYEQARGKRVVGQTADAGFQVGVRRTVAATPAEVWELLTTRPELWLGPGASVAFDKGAHYDVPPGDDAPATSGQVRVVKPGDRLRMTWHPEGWPVPATLQVALTEPSAGKTVITAHLERLPDADAREDLRSRWRETLERVSSAL